MTGDFMGGGGQSFPFDKVGDTVTGVIQGPNPYEKRTQTKTDGSGLAKTFPDGTPMTMFQVRLLTNLRDPANQFDDGIRSVFLKWKSQAAVQTAVRAAGAQDLAVGGTLTLQFVGEEPPTSRGQQPVKLWRAHYVAPPPGFMVEQAPSAQPGAWGPQNPPQQPQYPPQPQYAPQPAAQPWPQPEPTWTAPPQPMHPGPNPQQPQWGPPPQYGPPQAVPGTPPPVMAGPPPGVNHHGQPQAPQPPDWAQPPMPQAPVQPDPWAGTQATPVPPAVPVSAQPRQLTEGEMSVVERLRAQALQPHATGAPLPPPPNQEIPY